MKSSGLWAGALATGAVAWAAAPELAAPARLLTALLVGAAPAVFLMQARAAQALTEPLPRIPVYWSSIVALWVLAAITLGGGLAAGFSAADLGLQGIEPGALAAWTGFGLAASGVIVAGFKVLGMTESAIMREITPRTPGEKGVFILLSISAGVCEEIAFRGFLLTALAAATGSLALGVIISSLVFGVLHAHQQASGAVRASCMGAALAVPVIVTGSLYPAMLAHALVDIVGGLWLARWLLEEPPAP